MPKEERKQLRLKNYDYSQDGAYFITVCTQNKVKYFGNVLNGKLELNDVGKLVYLKFEELQIKYHNLTIDKFVIMPNHLHAILLVHKSASESKISLSEYIKRFKTLTTKLIIDKVKEGKFPSFENKIWQKSFYDHIIRNKEEYIKVWEYIDTNPLKWDLDKYYIN